MPILKSKNLIIFLTLTALIVVVSGCFKKPPVNNNANQNQNLNANQNTNTSTTTTEIDTSDWKTYRNEEYGFEFRYPEKIGSVTFVLNDPPIENYYGLGGKFAAIIRPLPWQDYMFAIAVKDKNFTKEDFLENRPNRSSLRTFDLADKNADGFYFQYQDMLNYSIFVEGINYNYLVVGGGCDEINLESTTCVALAYTINVVDNIIKTIKIE